MTLVLFACELVLNFLCKSKQQVLFCQTICCIMQVSLLLVLGRESPSRPCRGTPCKYPRTARYQPHNHYRLRDQLLCRHGRFVNRALGRHYNYLVAMEGALKLKEISYIHAEGYSAAEMKHGPIALIDENMPVVVIAPKDALFDKIISNIREIKARGGKVIAVTTQDCSPLDEFADDLIHVPTTLPMLMPILTCVPLQLLAYHIATLRGNNVDQPRNLAKSVTVE